MPEGFTRKTIADSIHTDSDDYISILKELGRECLGAVQIIDESTEVQKTDYKELTKEDVKALAEEGASKAVNLVIKSHLSLTGASGKTGLYEDEIKLWRSCVFNFLIGNTDNHIKNYSLVYGKDLHTVRLAPCYDVVSTKIYENSTNEMSLSINGKLNIEEITRADFEAEAKTVGLGANVAMRIYDEVADGLPDLRKII